jgi:hypothetical protein
MKGDEKINLQNSAKSGTYFYQARDLKPNETQRKNISRDLSNNTNYTTNFILLRMSLLLKDINYSMYIDPNLGPACMVPYYIFGPDSA